MSVNFNKTPNLFTPPPVTTAKLAAQIDSFLKQKDSDCIKNGIGEGVFRYIGGIFEAEGFRDLETFSKVHLEGSPADFVQECSYLSIPGFLDKMANDELLEDILIKLHLSFASLLPEIQNNPEHKAHVVINKLSHILILKIRELKHINAHTFILSCGEQINECGEHEKLFCHFHKDQWQAHPFTIPRNLQSDNSLFFAPLNLDRSQGIMFDNNGNIVSKPLFFIQGRKLNELDSENAQLYLSTVNDPVLKQLGFNKINPESTQKIEMMIEACKKGLFHFDIIHYDPWEPNTDENSNCLVFSTEFAPSSNSFLHFVLIAKQLENAFNKTKDSQPKASSRINENGSKSEVDEKSKDETKNETEGSIKIQLDQEIQNLIKNFVDGIVENLKDDPEGVEQIFLEPSIIRADGLEKAIEQLPEKELLQLQCDLLEQVVKEEKDVPGSLADLIDDIAKEQNISSSKEGVSPLDIADQMLHETKEKIQSLKEPEKTSAIIAPQMIQKDKQVRASLEQQLETAESVPLPTKADKKKAYKQRKKKEKALQEKLAKNQNHGKEEVKPTSSSNANPDLPKLRNKDKKEIAAIKRGSSVKGRVLFKLAMKMVDGVKNVKGSHFSTTVEQKDGSSDGVTVVKKHGGDNTVSKASANKTLKKIFALRNKK